VNDAAPSTTTSEQDRKSAGQRRVNIIWEVTQAAIAWGAVGTILFVAARIALLAIQVDVSDKQLSLSITAFLLLSNLGSLIIGFYFGRTNHQRSGGVGGDSAGER